MLIRGLFALLLCGLLASSVWAAITVDLASVSSGTSSTSASHTLAASANIILVCVQSYDSVGSVIGASAVTVGGQGATPLLAQTSSAGVVRTELWYKLSPLTGAQTVAATGDATTDKMVTGVISFVGVAQSSTFNTAGTPLSASVSNVDIVSIPSAVDEMVVLCGASQQSSPDLSASPDSITPVSTEQFDLRQSSGGASVLGFGYTEAGAASTIDMRVDLNASANTVGVAVSMHPLASSAPATPTDLHVAGPASSTSATFIWAPNTETDLTGYKVYVGTASGQTNTLLATITAATAAASHSSMTLFRHRRPVAGTMYYTVAAYGAGGESAKSSEVSVTVAGIAARTPISQPRAKRIHPP